MSAPAFAWAIEKGMELRLTPSERLLLLYMADQANCSGVFCTGQPKMVEATGLCLRTVRTLIPRLAGRGLVLVDGKPGLPTTYRLLRQLNGVATPATIAAQAGTATPANITATPAIAAPPPRQPLPPNPGKISMPPRQNPTVTPATIAPDPSLPKKSTQDARERAREGQEENRREKASKPAPQPDAPHKAPIIGTTDGSGNYRPMVPAVQRSGSDYLDSPTADDALPKAEADAIATDQEAKPPDPLMAAKLATLAANLARGFQNNYPPRLSPLTADEQRDLAAPRQRFVAKPLNPVQIAAMRRLAGIQVRAS